MFGGVDGSGNRPGFGVSLRRWYPIPSATLIGVGLCVLLTSLLDTTLSGDVGAPSAPYTLFFSFMITIGWILSFTVRRKSAFGDIMRVIGLDFVIIGFLFSAALSGASSGSEVMYEDSFAEAYILVVIFFILASPLTYIIFWLGIVKDSLPSHARIRYYLLALHPALVIGTLALLAIAGDAWEIWFLLGPALGASCVAMGVLVNKRMRLAEEKGEFDIDKARMMAAKDREFTEQLGDMGFRG